MVNIEDFAKLDIRIGTITSAEKVPEADKLLKLSVDLGEDHSEDSARKTRQIMAGVAETYPDPKELIGKQIPIITNLEPRKIRGYESQGMMIAVENENKVALLHPSEKIPNGSKLR